VPPKKDLEVMSAEELAAELQRLIDATVGPDDAETHHDLAVAYEAMGLLEEALSEYRIVLEIRRRKAGQA
jgi:Flp pilus assembly protein TadD